MPEGKAYDIKKKKNKKKSKMKSNSRDSLKLTKKKY
jgi:hypothetical protein|tara:strand:+ start:338 stop:445 length:108 start_codon:yes stop_codon:yes gene_type:complete